MDRARMIQAIVREAKNAAFLENKPFDAVDLFITLTFRSDDALASICKGLRIPVRQEA